MSHKRVLVVEDDEDIRRNVVDALELEDYEVHEASNGKEALDYLLRTPEELLPQCIILDLMMPVMDGEQFLNELEPHLQRLGKIRVIVGTAKGKALDPKLSSKTVARLHKPFELDELYRVVQKHCT